MDFFQRIGFIVGWLCFALAFIGAAAEGIVGQGLVTPLSDVLSATVPDKWLVLKSQFEESLFSFLLIPIDYLPGWLIAGLPSGFLLWTCRPHRENVDPEIYESLMLYDHLAKMADEEKAANDDPTFQDLNLEPDLDFIEEVHEDQDITLEEEKSLHKPLKQTLGGPERMDEARTKMSIPFDKLS